MVLLYLAKNNFHKILEAAIFGEIFSCEMIIWYIQPITHVHIIKVLYFLEYFQWVQWVLLIFECARMWVQVKGGNKTRAGLIKVLHLCVH